MGGALQNLKNMTVGSNSPHDGGNECSFPLVLFPDADVVISPSDVKLGEQSGLLHIIDEFWDKGKWVGILDSVGVQVMIVLTWAQTPILLGYEEEGGGLGGF